MGRIPEIMEITSQQFEILLSIYKLESEGKLTRPRDINAEYSLTYGKEIQHSNFFRQMKQLHGKGLIGRNKRATYSINLENIRRLLSGKRENLQRELKEFDRISARTDEYFRRLAFDSTRPLVNYLDHDETFKRICGSLKNSRRVYASMNFPLVAYTYALADGINRKRYLEVIWDKCFKKETLEVNCLTTLDIDVLFNHAFRVYGDPEQAYKECSIVMEQLRNLVERHENLKIKYLKEFNGIDVLIPEDKEPVEFFLFMKDEHRDIMGGIHIRSPETALSARNSFMRDYEYATEIRGETGKKILDEVRNQLEERHEIIRGQEIT